MRNQKGNPRKNLSAKSLLNLLCRPIYAMRNRLETAVEDGRSAVTAIYSGNDLIAQLRQLNFTEHHIRRLDPLLNFVVTRRLIQEWVCVKNVMSLYELSQALDTVRALGASVGSLRWEFEGHDWIDRFPTALHDSLVELSCASKDAEAIAEKLLSHDVPSHKKLARERAFLLGALDEGVSDSERHARFVKRVADIDQLLSEPPKLSGARIRNLRQKIQQRATFECERTLSQRIRIAISRSLQSHKIDVTKVEIEDSLLVMLVHHIHELGASLQSQGWTVLRHALIGNELRWDDYEANRKFVDSIQRRGIVIDPWLDQNRNVVVRVDSGERVTLQFTRSAMDYLLMGHHFSTCLSPDDENFYSTIANALDVNKQVLYARTDEGRVVGRCLMTLGSEGELLIYQVYAHHWYQELCSGVKKFADDLARDMKTRVVTLASVMPLVVEDWYDDEPIDINEEVQPTEKANPIEVQPPPIVETPSPSRLGAIDLSGASQEYLVDFAADYHRYV